MRTKQFFSALKNRFFVMLICLYVVLLLFASFMTCYYSYHQKRETLLSQINRPYIQLAQEYRNITDNFWQLYMPFFESQSKIPNALKNYFSSKSQVSLSPFEKKELANFVSQIFTRNDDIQWIVLYSSERTDNYIIFCDNLSLQPLNDDFPYLENLSSDTSKMHIYGVRPFTTSSSSSNCYAISGGIPTSPGKGKILAGYTTSTLYALCNNNTCALESLNYVLTNNDEIVFDYSEQYQEDDIYSPNEEYNGVLKTPDGKRLYVNSQTCGLKSSILSFSVSWWEFFCYCHQNTPMFILIFLVFTLISIMGYIILSHMQKKEVAIINKGLTKIGENDLDYRISDQFTQSGLPEIASSINNMTLRLKENINRAYYYELKHREAELAELQSKFNPHFLYNTLEMIRSRCQQNGDETTQNLITQMAAIFRGFIGSKTFVPMTEELTFSKRYLTLFGARYEDMIEIRYDFDKEILQYGIIRNVFQPLIENYFVHGFDTSNEENYILFKGKSLDEKTMILTVEDNGCGMSDEEIERLNAKLHEPIQISTESYGLKNLHQRLQLFYGEGYGLTICQNPNCTKGISIQMTALKMTCEEYEQDKKNVTSPAK